MQRGKSVAPKVASESNIENNNITKPLSNKSLVYDLNSPIFKELFSILMDSSNNQKKETQLKIEYFLKNQAVEFTKLKKSFLDKDSIYNNVSHVLINLFLDKKILLEKLIVNYKTNLKLKDEKLSSLYSQIMYSSDIEFLINILLLINY